MSLDLKKIYKDLILDYSRTPKNFFIDESEGTIKIEANNPLCGDSYTLYLHLDADQKKITSLSFTGVGCAISKASASIMTDTLKDKSIDEAIFIFEIYHSMLTDNGFDFEANKDKIGKLQIFEHLISLPMRVKCATTAWHPLIHKLKEVPK